MSRIKTIRGREKATLLSVSYTPSTEQAVTVDDASDYGKAKGQDVIVDTLIDAGMRAFEAFTGKLIYQVEVTAVFEPINYEARLWMPWLPIESVTSVKDEDDEDVEHEIKGDSLIVDAWDEITVVYTAGLYETGDKIDGELILGLYKWIASNYNDREDVAFENPVMMPNESRQHWVKFKANYL